MSETSPDILIVDDIPQNLRLLMKILADEGYNVRPAKHGRAALMTIEAKRPDLILLDIQMPELDGYQVCEQLKANPDTENIPIIFISAHDELFDKARAFAVGGVDYITKPFQAEEVLMRVNTHLTLSRLYQQVQTQNVWLEDQIRTRTAVLQETDAALQTEIRQSQRHAEEKDKLFVLAQQQSDQLRDLTSWLITAQRQPPQNQVSVLPARGDNALTELTSREIEVLTLLANGRSSTEIGRALNLSAVTIRTYRTRIMKKLDIHHLAGLVKFALKYNLTDPL